MASRVRPIRFPQDIDEALDKMPKGQRSAYVVAAVRAALARDDRGGTPTDLHGPVEAAPRAVSTKREVTPNFKQGGRR